jgi:Kef-type K+ transport system membrane component KefB
VLVLAALVLLAVDVGFDSVLGAFAAGLIVGLTLDSADGAVVRMRLEGMAFGLLIPIYFVVTGVNFDIDSLLTVHGLALAARFLVLLLVVRGASALLWRRDVSGRQLGALVLFGATGLPLIVAIVGVAMDRGAVSARIGARRAGSLTFLVGKYTLLSR